MTTTSPALRTAIQLAMSKAPKCDKECLAPLRTFPMLEIVQGMQPELTAKEPKTIPIALQVLAFAAIEREGDTLCGTQELEVLFAFLVAKVNHFTTIDSAVDSAARVFVWYANNHPKLLTDTTNTAPPAVPILKSVINNMLCKISVPSMFGNSKTSAFNLLKALLLPAIVDSFTKEYTKSFLEAFLVSVDGERDPAFVLEVFVMSKSILTSFSAASLSDFTEEYFMTLSNYFPVLFNPPPRCTVTKEQLKDALTEVLVLPIFHEVCIPFVLSKLSSPAEVAKVDSLALLCEMLSGVGRKRGGGGCCGGNKGGCGSSSAITEDDNSNSAGCCSTTPPSPSYTLSLIEPHLTDIVGSLRGEALKLAAAVAFNPSAKDLLRLVMAAAEEVGRLLDIIAGSTSSSREAALSHCDRMLSSCMGAIEAGSDARAYAMLLNSICRSGDNIAGVVVSYLLPQIGAKMVGMGTSGAESDNTVNEHEQRVFMAAVAVVGGMFSALEMRRNSGQEGKEDTPRAVAAAVIIRPQTIQSIIDALTAVVESSTAHAMEDTLPLIGEVLSTYLAIRDTLPGSDLVAPSNQLLSALVKRACATHTSAEAASVTLKAIGNVGRVATNLVVSATVSNHSLLFELAASPRLPSFFVDIHRAIGDKASVRSACFDALLFKGEPTPLVATAITIFGIKSPTLDAYLHAVALFAGSETSALPSSPAIKATIEHILTLGIPEQSGAGADLLCELLARCPEAQQPLLADQDPASSGRVVSWLCAVSSAKGDNDNGNSTGGLPAYYRPQWIAICYEQITKAHDPASQTRSLALRAIATIAFKVNEVSASTFEDALGTGAATISDGDKASIRAAVSKGLLAKGAEPLTTLRPLLDAVDQFGSSPVSLDAKPAVAASSSMSLLVSAYEQLLSPPYPSTATKWLQVAYSALCDTLLTSASPLSLVCLAAVIAKAPLKVVSPTIGEVIGKLVAILEAGNALTNIPPKKTVQGPTATTAISSPSVAAMLVIATILDRSDGMPLDAVQMASSTLLTYTVAARSLYGLAYTKTGARVTPMVPMAVRDMLVSSLLATQAVVSASAPATGAKKSAAPQTSEIAKAAAADWIIQWLSLALDDPKRPIRTLAAKCSHEWHKVK